MPPTVSWYRFNISTPVQGGCRRKQLIWLAMGGDPGGGSGRASCAKASSKGQIGPISSAHINAGRLGFARTLCPFISQDRCAASSVELKKSRVVEPSYQISTSRLR